MLELKTVNLEEPNTEEFDSGSEDAEGIFVLFNDIFGG
jgi:hypothetical protein